MGSLLNKVVYRGPGAIAVILIALILAPLSAQSYISFKRHTAMTVMTMDGAAVLKRGPDDMFHGYGYVNGHKVQFLLDTGASDVTLSESFADKIGIERGADIKYHTAGGIISGSDIRLDSIEIGGLVLRDVRAGTVPMDGHDDTVILGMSALGKLSLYKDADTMTLKPL